MKPFLGFFLSVLVTSSLLAQITPDVATQRVLKQYGVESKILRAFDELETKSKRPDGRFELHLAGTPEVHVLLDRDYWALTSWDAKKPRNGSSYILNPKDGQSALNITVDEGKTSRSGVDRRNDPGFSGYSSREGFLAGSPVSWRRCSDANHLYSEATVTLTSVGGNKGSTYSVRVDVTANTEARRQALEDCMATLELRKLESEKDRPNSESSAAPERAAGLRLNKPVRPAQGSKP